MEELIATIIHDGSTVPFSGSLVKQALVSGFILDHATLLECIHH
jgi:hypothetical protein